MIKKFCSILCIITLLTSCSSGEQILLPYAENQVDILSSKTKDTSSANDTVSLMAKKLCVSSLNRKEKEDSQIPADTAMLADITKGKILFAKNEYSQIYPASITKIVTALVTLKYGKLSETVTISYDASHITEPGAVTCGFKEGDKVQLKTLLYAFLIKSGNDAGIAIAEHVGGSVEKFTQMMNDEVRKLGGVHSNFVNPHGLHDDKHYTTAYDIYLVFNELLTNKKYKSTFKDIIKTNEFIAEYTKADGVKANFMFTNTNQYISGQRQMPENITVMGGKTGTTSKAGSCLVLYSKDENKKEYLSFVFHATDAISLYNQMDYLLSKTQ